MSRQRHSHPVERDWSLEDLGRCREPHAACWLAYDNDASGNQAAQRLAQKLGEEGISCWRVRLPRGMDPKRVRPRR